MFRPLADGVYLLTFYGLVQGTDGGTVFIKRNDDRLCKAWLDHDNSIDIGTCTAIAELTTSDSVQVTGDSSEPSTLRGNLYSGFTGFLIYDI